MWFETDVVQPFIAKGHKWTYGISGRKKAVQVKNTECVKNKKQKKNNCISPQVRWDYKVLGGFTGWL